MISAAAMQIAKKLYNKNAEELHLLAGELIGYNRGSENLSKTTEKIAQMAIKNEKRSEYYLTYSIILLMNNKTKKALKNAEIALGLVGSDEKTKQQIMAFIDKAKGSEKS